MPPKLKAQNSKRKTITQNLKLLGKYSILLTIKESYLLSRNLLGLIFHPFKTLKVILRERDYSQAFLVFGLPVYIFIAGLVFIISSRFLIGAPKQWGLIAKFLFFCFFLTAFYSLGYLIYWLFKIKKLK